MPCNDKHHLLPAHAPHDLIRLCFLGWRMVTPSHRLLSQEPCHHCGFLSEGILDSSLSLTLHMQLIINSHEL